MAQTPREHLRMLQRREGRCKPPQTRPRDEMPALRQTRLPFAYPAHHIVGDEGGIFRIAGQVTVSCGAIHMRDKDAGRGGYDVTLLQRFDRRRRMHLVHVVLAIQKDRQSRRGRFLSRLHEPDLPRAGA